MAGSENLLSAVIQAEHISKQFTLNRHRAGDLRELVSSLWKPRQAHKASTEPFYALRDVSFSIGRGEAVGIVGHNGSGKSTLLKMLTGIMKPDTGALHTHGRIGALIEVGAGFHPDLSGRENVYLNGSILGLNRQEIAAKFDEIVAFAGLERFIDTPVKRYSSGMYMRLGFAIATHIDPEILLIDEVLAVGDTQFQRKCIRRLQEFKANGGTVVFVSHAMSQVSELCQRCLWLDRGQLLHDGPTEDAIDKYMAIVAEREEEEFRRTHPEDWEARQAEKAALEQEEADQLQALEAEQLLREQELAKREAHLPWRQPDRSRLLSVQLRAKDGTERTRFLAGEPVRVEMTYRFARTHSCPTFCFEVYRDPDNLHMFTTSNFDHELLLNRLPAEGTVAFDIPMLTLPEGKYRVRLCLYTDWRPGDWESCLEDVVDNALTFTVNAGRFAHGSAFLPVDWQPALAGRENSSVREVTA